jgi:hypothetical protein
MIRKNRGSSVNIVTATGWTTRDSIAGWGGDFSLFTIAVSRLALRPMQPPVQWVPGALSQGVKRPGIEADHSSPPSAEVKNAWSYISTPPYILIEWCLVKHRDNFAYLICGLNAGFVNSF